MTKKRQASPEGEETTTSDYFGNGKTKGRKATQKKQTSPVNSPTKPRAVVISDAEEPTPLKRTPRSTRAKADVKIDVDEILSDDFEEMPPKTTNGRASRTSTPASTKAKRTKSMKDEEFEDGDGDGDLQTGGRSSTKRKVAEMRDEGHNDDDDKTAKKKTKRAPAKSGEIVDSTEIQDILSNIPTIRAPTPPPRDETGKFKFVPGGKNMETPAGAGSKALPQGAENCLAGMTFVFTGLLETLSREVGTDLVKRHGGKVLTAPSKSTSFIVLGDDAGPSKLRKIQEHGLKTIDENGLFALIERLPANGGDSKVAAKAAEKQAKVEEKIVKDAADMEKAEKARKMEEVEKADKNGKSVNDKIRSSVDSRLWTEKYAPTQISQICGNTAQVTKLQNWLRNFPRNAKTKFKLPGPDGSGTFRAVIIHGPPGVGKTTSAHLVAKLEGYDIVESNASDTRSKKLVETGLKGVLDTKSLFGYFAGDGKEVEIGKKKLCLIMDEVDGMSAGDRGGVGAMAAVCRKSNVPIILICNDRKQPKMKPFDFVAYDLPFRRPSIDQIKGRIMTIMYREGMKYPAQVLSALIEGTGSDIRQIVNMISTAKLDDKTNMEYEDSRQMSKAWEKHIVLKPWDIVSKILGGGMFSAASTSTLGDKIELYFNDHEFSYLMLQENYLGTNPIRAREIPNKKYEKLKALQLASRAAESISDGDLVDRMIHGSQQQWSLMPAHAVFSFVRPASYMAGNMGYNNTRFTQWLGQNSAYGKFSRLVKEIQGHMRLRTTGDRHEIRQQYLPVLWKEMIGRLQAEGKEAVDEVIKLMDSYYLTKDDFDAISELGVGPHNFEKVKIASQDKATFTRE